MILTVTLNPSVDIGYKLEDFQIDQVNRVKDISKTAGGKGLNVSRVLKQLGQEVYATGFLGGSLGNFIQSKLKEMNIHDSFVSIQGDTRNCIGIIHNNGKQTEILEGGPRIKSSEAEEFLKKFEETIKKIKFITISGSLPEGLESSFYNNLLSIANRNNKRVLLDTGGNLLRKALEHDDKPFLIKPNEDEIEDLVGENLDNENQLIKSLSNPLFSNIEWVVVTLGSKGAVIKYKNNIYKATIPEVKAVNPVGSGDSVIAGLADGLVRELEPIELIKNGLAMGVLNALEEKTGYINPNQINLCTKEIKVEEFI